MTYEIFCPDKDVLWSYYRRLRNYFRAQGQNPAQVKINNKECILTLQGGNRMVLEKILGRTQARFQIREVN